MAAELLALKDIHLTFGSTPLLEGADLSVGPGDRICLVGRNGSGKSTLLKIAAGLIEPDSGTRFAHPGARIATLAQEADLSGHETTLEAVLAYLGETDDEARARALLGALGFTGAEATGNLSGGETRRVAIAQVLAASPDVLLLDEPTNHLDLPTIEWLEAEIVASTAAIVLISHDRRFLERLTRTCVWLDRGRVVRLDQGFSAFEAWRDDRLAQEELERHKLDRKIARENEWMHGGVTARRKRNVRRVAELGEMRKQRGDARPVTGNVRMESQDAAASGKLVIEAKGVSKTYDDRPIVHDLSIRIARGDRVGLVGPNGAGKTTLISLLTGALQPDAGTVKLGTNLEMVTLDQRREELRPDWTIADALTGGRGDQVIVGGKARHVASYMKDFLFTPEQMRTPLKALSGGERGRLMLARALAKPSNLLVLDEPTNDLDLETLDLLQELLADYQGTVLLVSHDRDFLDRIVTSVIATDGDGHWIEYAGGYTDMRAQRRANDMQKTATGRKSGLQSNGGMAGGAERDRVSPTTQRRKLSFKDKHALDTLPATLAALEGEIASLSARLADPRLFTSDPKAFKSTSERLAAAQLKLAAAEEQWLELELLKEELSARD
jgi:ABC transport system ATP-binding/permease protein